MSDDPFKDDELIEVKLPRKDYDMLRRMLEREEAYSWITNKLRNWWVFAVASGLLTLWALYDIIRNGSS